MFVSNEEKHDADDQSISMDELDELDEVRTFLLSIKDKVKKVEILPSLRRRSRNLRTSETTEEDLELILQLIAHTDTEGEVKLDERYRSTVAYNNAKEDIQLKLRQEKQDKQEKQDDQEDCVNQQTVHACAETSCDFGKEAVDWTMACCHGNIHLLRDLAMKVRIIKISLDDPNTILTF